MGNMQTLTAHALQGVSGQADPWNSCHEIFRDSYKERPGEAISALEH